MFVATVEYMDGSRPDEVRGYQEANHGNGVVQFMWEEELLTIPLHRIKSISETTLKEGQGDD